jgi:hypothetical protein
VVRQFNLADILLVRRLQGQGVYLDLETALVWCPSPLWGALIDYLSIDQGHSSTFVEDDSSTGRPVEGFLQAYDRADRLSCDVICIAPSLRGSSAALRVWHDLLEHLCLDKGERGMQRVFAKVSEDEAGMDVFRQVGFSSYGRRHVFRLKQLPPDLPSAKAMLLRPMEKADVGGLQQLRNSLMPRPVQQAEGGIKAERDLTGLLPWWRSRQIREYVSEHEGEIQAYLRVVAGEEGHWLRIMLRPEALQQADRILAEALLLLSAYPARPIYCGVREYEPGLHGALGERGFEPFASELLMVKQTTVRAAVPVSKLSPALEKQVETAAPISRSNRCK